MHVSLSFKLFNMWFDRYTIGVGFLLHSEA